jgi:hypothetical protein
MFRVRVSHLENWSSNLVALAKQGHDGDVHESIGKMNARAIIGDTYLDITAWKCAATSTQLMRPLNVLC